MPFKKGPWLVYRSIERYKNKVAQVNEDNIAAAGGEEAIFTIVRLKPGVSVLPIDEESNVYLTKEYRYAIQRESVETVSGAIEENESAENAARRELREELGITARLWIDLGRVDPLTSQLHAPAQLFVARNLTFSEPHRDTFELIEVVKMQLEEAVGLVIESKITHAPSAVLILKVKQWMADQGTQR